MNIKRWLRAVRDKLIAARRKPVVLRGRLDGPAAWLGLEPLEDRVVPQASSSANYASDFVSQLYTDLLSRTADSGGLAFWSQQISAGQSADSVALGIMASPEYRNDLVNQIYVTYLHRGVDQPSQAFWAGQLGSQSVQVIEAQIIGSQEFYDKAGNTISGFLEALYTDALGRNLDSGGADTYGALLEAGTSRTSIAYDVLSSPEYRTDLIESYYETFLHRPADGAGLAFWVGQLDRGASDQDVIAGMVSSPEYVNRTPGVPTVTEPSAAITSSATSFTIAGLAESGDRVQVFNSSGSVVGSEQLAGTETTFSISVPLTSNAANNFEVAETNAFGTESAKVAVPTITQGTPEVTVTAPAEQSDDEGTTITPLTVSATDSKGNTLTYAATGLPAGLSIDSTTGVISGTITSGDSAKSPYKVTVTATAAATGASGSATFTWVVATTNSITVTSPGDQSDVEGATAKLQITAKESNKNTLKYSATGLPSGLSIEASTGLIAGTVAAGDATSSPYSVTVSVTDGVNTQTTSFTWTVTPAVIVSTPANQSSLEGNAVSLSISATDHYNKALTYSATGLPSGLTIDSTTGKITGTVAAGDASSSPYTVTVTAADGTYSGSATFTWTVTSNITVTNPGTQTNTEGDTLFLDIAASDAVSGKTLTFSATGLPTGLSIDSSTGKISGTLPPGSSSGSPYTVTVTVTDGTNVGSTTFAWDVVSPVTVTNPGGQNNSESNSVSLQMSASDTISGAVITGYSATGLPSGLSIDSTSGLISGTVAAGDASSSPYSVTVTATDGTYSGSTTFQWTIAPAVVFTNPGAQTGVEGTAANLTVSASDASGGTLTYSATGLPAGLSIDPASGTITGTFTAGDATSSPYTVTVSATDLTYSGSTTFKWTVNSPISITPISNQSNSEGDTVNLTVSASDSSGNTLSYAATGLPAGLSINSTSGAITGTVGTGDTSSSPYTVTVTASDGVFTPASSTFTWSINSIVSVPNPGSQTSQEGAGINLSETGADKNSLTLTYSATGLPAGLSIDSSSGLIGGFINSGDTTSSPYTVTVTATDGTNSGSATFTWKVNPQVTITPVAEQSDHDGAVVTLPVTASDGTANALTFSATGLPTGLSISSSTGIISGTIASTADTSSPYTATITVTDATTGATDVTNITWLVFKTTDPLLDPPATQLNLNGDVVSGVTVTATKANSTAITYTASGLPSGLAINSSTGVISGTISSSASDTSPYTVTVTASEGSGVSSSAKFTWVVTSSSTASLPVSLTSPAWVTLSSGVRYMDVIPGSGTAVADGDPLTVNYIGYLTDGTDFNSGNGFPSTLDTNHLIAGWVDGVPGMKPGGVRYLDIPASLAYGSAGSPPTIPANAELVFEISLSSDS